MTTQYNLNSLTGCVNGFGLMFCDTKYSVTLGAATEATLTVPGAAPSYKAVFHYKPSSSVWIALNKTAAVPAGATFAATDSCLNPDCRIVKAGDVIHAISATAATDVSVEFFAQLG